MTNHQAEIQRKNVKDLIYELGINMKSFAEKTGVSYGTCTGNFGKGANPTAPSKRTLELIEESCGLEPGFLSTPADQRNGPHAPGKDVTVITGSMASVAIVFDDGQKVHLEVTKEQARKLILDVLD